MCPEKPWECPEIKADEARVEAIDKPLETPLIDPIAVATGGAVGAVRGVMARKAVTTAATNVGAASASADVASSAATQAPGAVGQITGFTRHGVNQVINRGVKPADMVVALKNATPVRLVDQAGRVSYRYVGEKATVVLNEAGKLVTAW